MAEEFLGIGWQYPVQLSKDGDVALSAYEQNIRESIILILKTSPGERVMRPEYGCDITGLVFSENSMATAGLAAHYVEAALIRWEPRIELLGVSAQPDSAGGKLNIQIRYRVIRTNSIFNMVYPFYLIEGVGV